MAVNQSHFLVLLKVFRFALRIIFNGYAKFIYSFRYLYRGRTNSVDIKTIKLSSISQNYLLYFANALLMQILRSQLGQSVFYSFPFTQEVALKILRQPRIQSIPQ